MSAVGAGTPDAVARGRGELVAFAALSALAAGALAVRPEAAFGLCGLALLLAALQWRIEPWAALGCVLAATLLLSADFRLAGPIPIDLTAERIALFLLVAAWMFGLLDVQPGWPEQARRVNRPLACFALLAVVTLLIDVPELVADDMLLTGIKRIVTLVGFVLVYSLVLALVRRKGDVLRVVRLMVGLGAVAASSAGVERFAGTNPLRRFQAALPIFEQHVIEEIMIRGTGARAYGTAAHPIEFGGMMALLLPLAVYLVFSAGSRRAAAGWTVAACLILLGLLFSVSRSSLLSAAVGFAALVVLSKKRWWIAALALAGLFAVHLAMPGLLGTLRSVLDPTWLVRQEATSFDGRMNDWPIVWHLFLDRPLVGVGLSLFDPVRFFFLDNQYLKFLLELGILGVMSVLWLLAAVLRLLFRRAWALRRVEPVSLEAALFASVLGYAVLSALFDTFGFLQITNLFFAIVGLSVVVTSSDDTSTAEEVPVAA